MNKFEAQPRYDEFDLVDEIDLRQFAITILRQWKVIAGMVALVVATVAVVNTYVLSPIYESSAVVMFRNDQTALDIDFHAFQALSSSPAVMSEVGRRTGSDWSIADMTRHFDFKADNKAPMMTVTVRAGDPRLTVGLVNAWIDAVRAETLHTMESRLMHAKNIVEENFRSHMEALLEAENALAAFDREHPIALMQVQLQRNIQKLVADEQLLVTLKDSTIPTNEATAAALREVLTQENATIDSNLLVPSPITGDMQFKQLNPTYVELRQRLTALESSLAADRRRVELLEESLPAFRAQVNEANTALIDARLQRERLERGLVEARALFEEARTERDEILGLERQLKDLSRVVVISGPVLPDRPVSPRKMLNLAVGAMLGFMVAVSGVLVAEWWRSPVGADVPVQNQVQTKMLTPTPMQHQPQAHVQTQIQTGRA